MTIRVANYFVTHVLLLHFCSPYTRNSPSFVLFNCYLESNPMNSVAVTNTLSQMLKLIILNEMVCIAIYIFINTV